MNRRSRERYAPLNGNYYHDDAVDEAGLLGELLFVRSLAFCAANLTDGWITDRQLSRVVAVGMPDPDGLAKTLVDVGLWERDDGAHAYKIRQWTKYNRTREEITRARARDAARKRKGSMPADSGDGLRTDSGRNPDGIQTEGRRNPATTTQHNTTQRESVRPEGAGRTDSPAEPFDLSRFRDEQISRPFRGGR